MSESLGLTTPITPSNPTISQYRIVRLLLEREPFALILVVVADNRNVRTEVAYSDDGGGTVAASLLHALNTADLSVKSLQRRVLEYLVSDGKLPAGSVSGTPD